MKRRDVEHAYLLQKVRKAGKAWTDAKRMLECAERELQSADAELSRHETICKRRPDYMDEDV